jgi:hypothetical protein
MTLPYGKAFLMPMTHDSFRKTVGKQGRVHLHFAQYRRLEHVGKDLEQRALDAWEAGYTLVFEAHLLVI